MCVFGCSPTAQDSIEHYCHCGTIQKVGLRIFRQALANIQMPRGIDETLLMKKANSEAQLQFQAVWTSLIYVDFNVVVHDSDGVG